MMSLKHADICRGVGTIAAIEAGHLYTFWLSKDLLKFRCLITLDFAPSSKSISDTNVKDALLTAYPQDNICLLLHSKDELTLRGD